ncbi:ATP-binding cassette domain-containing protein [Bordetella avium]|uniref:Molybdenum ABC transporter, ATP-binding protein n=1 Tax=Bordetella avium (strain 197N) TaxID=360910 RepID=Q2KXL1_BORA1|nr:ATP-binding cassette domain-containing protein [Bordetella avium]AZY49841.1 ABC transporter ATP-binding protein [Bordetella avium]RIQ12474.1 ATP-binding cassette domain-containing protein [Bordetella avium]RIQ17565.1 ATP-binding cassette domain-containing protein [Bordetella avium]RIQ32222.1 ATP-binding cassette domain-containing protein [Bordetella avium]RIQ37289.1 ATP-binding cassette domain-containing protein [Bordetella avium]
MIDIALRKTLVAQDRRFEMDVRLRTASRRVVLFGPSGAGKSMTLRAVAGLLRPDAGHIAVDGRVFYDSEQTLFLPPQARRVAYLFQDYALFPHLTVGQNVAFALSQGWFNPRRRGVSPQARRWIDAFELGPIINSYPAQISGGQKQRTALARALASEPALLLLDEPFSALDSQLRDKMRAELRQLLDGLPVPMMLITHDPADIDALGDAVFYLRDGRVAKSERCTASGSEACLVGHAQNDAGGAK